MEKKISIIVPCYNVNQYLDRCFDSLKNQTIGIENLEIIFVDDCSTDRTWEHLTFLEQKYPESISIIHCDENGRQGKARNIGMTYATAPYVGFVDSDDWVEPDMFEKMYEKIRAYDADVVMCDSWRDKRQSGQNLAPKKDEGKKDRFLLIDSEEKRKKLIAESELMFCVWNKLYKRELLQNNLILFPEKLAYEDHFFAMLLYFYVVRVYILEERLYHYFVNTQSTVMASNARHHFDILKVNTMLWDECKNRGLLESFREEIEYQFLALGYLTSIKMILLRFEEFPYDFFLMLKKEVVARVPDYRKNKYVAFYFTEIYQILLELLLKDMSREEIISVFDSLRAYVRRGLLKV